MVLEPRPDYNSIGLIASPVSAAKCSHSPAAAIVRLPLVAAVGHPVVAAVPAAAYAATSAVSAASATATAKGAARREGPPASATPTPTTLPEHPPRLDQPPCRQCYSMHSNTRGMRSTAWFSMARACSQRSDTMQNQLCRTSFRSRHACQPPQRPHNSHEPTKP